MSDGLRRGLALIAVAVIVALVGLPLAFDEGDAYDLGMVAFAIAIVIAIAGLSGIAKSLKND